MNRKKRLHFAFWTIASMGWIVAQARASSMPAYTVTDLGVGAVQFATDANGNGVVIGGNGQAYPFEHTDNQVTNPSALLSELPPLGNAPVWAGMTYGIPKFAYSYFDPWDVFLNKNGVFAGTDLVGVEGHQEASQSIAMAYQKQPGGTFSPLATLFESPNNLTTGGVIAQVLDLNNRNQVLGVTATLPYYYNNQLLLYDIPRGTTINLNALLPNWVPNPQGAELDDQGRILLTAASGTWPVTTHKFLLTPAGVSPDPVAVPEPTTLAVFVVGMGAALGRVRRKR